MRSAIRMMSIFCCSVVLLGSAQDQNSRRTSPPPDSCAILRQAIEDIGKVKAGMTRREVEEHFELDGGPQFRNGTRYIYPKCHEVTIKVEIEFKLADPVHQIEDSPNDTVVKVSKPYLGYPSKD